MRQDVAVVDDNPFAVDVSVVVVGLLRGVLLHVFAHRVGYRRYLLGLAMLALLCIAAAVTVFFVPVQKQQPQAQYLLKDNAGRLALYTPDGTGPLAQYDVYTRLLPEPDCLALQQGVSIYTEAELQQKLEDYGL